MLAECQTYGSKIILIFLYIYRWVLRERRMKIDFMPSKKFDVLFYHVRIVVCMCSFAFTNLRGADEWVGFFFGVCYLPSTFTMKTYKL